MKDFFVLWCQVYSNVDDTPVSNYNQCLFFFCSQVLTSFVSFYYCWKTIHEYLMYTFVDSIHSWMVQQEKLLHIPGFESLQQKYKSLKVL